jgi:hypothetical protein
MYAMVNKLEEEHTTPTNHQRVHMRTYLNYVVIPSDIAQQERLTGEGEQPHEEQKAVVAEHVCSAGQMQETPHARVQEPMIGKHHIGDQVGGDRR